MPGKDHPLDRDSAVRWPQRLGCAAARSLLERSINEALARHLRLTPFRDDAIFVLQEQGLTRVDCIKKARQEQKFAVMMGSCSGRASGMQETIEFRSHVSRSQRPALEALVFFNSCQERYAACIAEAVERFGVPEIVADGDRLRLRVSGLDEVQCLFAVGRDSGRPLGVAVYMRADLEHVTVVHLGIAAEYASGGVKAADQLLLRLLREVRRSTRRMKGVRRLELFYIKERSAASRWRDAKALV